MVYKLPRLICRALVVVAVLALSVSATTPSAFAQTTDTTIDGYPGNPDDPPDQPTIREVNFGPQEVGSFLNVTLCSYKAGDEVRITVNGQLVATLKADASGCVKVQIEVRANVGGTDALGATPTPLQLLAATGLRTAAASNVEIVVNGVPLTVGPYGSEVLGVATGTGANGQPRTVNFKFTVVKRGTIRSSGLVRTGADTLMRFAPLGASMLGVGYLMLLASRKRRPKVRL